jgi:hypothetical protein
MKKGYIQLFLLLTVVVGSYAGEELNISKSMSGYASMEEGQIVLGTYPGQLNGVPRADHVWVQRMYAGFVASALFNPLPIKANIGLEMRMSNEYPRKPRGDFGLTRRLYFYPYLTEADFIYHLGDAAKPLLSVTAGYFPIKYNQNSRNLGEYLFRSGTYPQTLTTDFDFAATRLAGVDVSSSPVEGLKLSLILNSNLEWTAVGDLNLSGLVTYNYQGIFEIGAGVSQSSIVSADPKATDGDLSSADEDDMYLKPNGDTAAYTFRGTKAMAMVSFDPKKLIGSDLFGKEDLKIYGEAAILGVKDYPASLGNKIDYYTDIMKRIPVMFGFNFPAFKFLDVLSIEGEWFGSLMPNDPYNGIFYNEPIPINVDTRLSNYIKDSIHQKYKDDNWKWSVYAKRTFAGHFQLFGQVASDHSRWYAQDWTKAEWEEAFRNPKQFYYRFKVAYLF